MLKKVAIHQVGSRPILFMGADRTLVMMLLIVCVTLVMSWDPLAMLAALLTFPVGLFFLRLMAKADPWMRHVYVRNRTYEPYYPARSQPWRVKCNRQNTPFSKK